MRKIEKEHAKRYPLRIATAAAAASYLIDHTARCLYIVWDHCVTDQLLFSNRNVKIERIEFSIERC